MSAVNLHVGVNGEVLLGALGEVVDAGVLDNRCKHEEETHQKEDVKRRWVGDFGNSGATRQSQSARCQQSCYSWTDTYARKRKR